MSDTSIIDKTAVDKTTVDKADISAVILAGGEGRRMGSVNKGLQSFKGMALAEQVAQRLSPQVSEVFLSCNADNDAYQALGFSTFNDDPFPNEGPLCAIAAAIKKVDTPYLAIAPCDCPVFPSNYLLPLGVALLNSDNDIAVVEKNGKIEPLFLLIKTNKRLMINSLIEQGERAVFNWLQQEKTIPVKFNETLNESDFVNLNTLEQLKDLENKTES